MKALTNLEKQKKRIQTDIAEMIMIALAYYLCDKKGFTGEEAMQTINYILGIIDTINDDKLTRRDLTEPLLNEYGLKFTRNANGFKIELEEKKNECSDCL